MRPLALLLAGLCAAPAARGQGIAWDIPHRGALEFDRTAEVLRVDAPVQRARTVTVVPAAEAGGHVWRYLRCAKNAAPPLWTSRDFDDSEWPEGRAMFGGDAGRDPLQRTKWTSAEICLRTRVDMGRRRPKAALFTIHHDDGVRVFWNGVRAVSNDGYGKDRLYVLAGEELDCWRRGDNVLAVQCNNVAGAQYIDAGVTLYFQWPRGSQDGPSLVQHVRDRQTAAGRLRREVFPAFRSPALLLQGELDGRSERVLRPPADLRDLGWFAATDLSRGVTAHTASLEAPRIFRFGDLGMRGRVTAVDADGWQELHLLVRTAPVAAPRDDTKRHVEMFVQRHCTYDFTGKLEVRRRVEMRGATARVVEFHSRLHGEVVQRGGADTHPVEHLETWRLRAVRENQDAQFRADVLAAIQTGCAAIHKSLGKLGARPLKATKGGNRSYPSGRLALAILALIQGGIPKDDEVLQRALTELKQRELVDTYSLGNALMALEAYYAPAGEYDDLRTGVIQRLRKREPSAEDLEVMKGWTEQLLRNVDTRVDKAYLLRFNYVRAGRFDNSVNQYGLLGLYSAHICGVPISPQVWEAAANHLLEVQGEPRRKVNLGLVDYRSHARMAADPDARRTVSRSRLVTQAAGWHYQWPTSGGEPTPNYGSMTCAGITGLTICQAALQDYDLRRQRLMHDATRARDRGFAWLALNLQTRYHPGWIGYQQRWIYYYLYSLERACLLSGVALVQDRDWYYEGAMVLLHLQQADGSWPGEFNSDEPIVRNAMAVLFLKKAALPVFTGR